MQLQLSNLVSYARAWLPGHNTVDARERMRAVAGAAIGLLLTGLLCRWMAPLTGHSIWLIAPMGASAVLVFAVPASPLAQPWSVLVGNTLSTLVGIACVRWIPDTAWAAAAGVGLAIGLMFATRSLHPPGGAAALLAVLTHTTDFSAAFFPAFANSLLLVLAGVAYNSLTGRRYPHVQLARPPSAEAGEARFSQADIDAVLARYNQVLDISRDDLESLFLETEMRAYSRRFGIITCGEIMSKDAVTVEDGTALAEAWRLMRAHKVHALPVLDPDGWVQGIISQSDFVRGLGMDDYASLGRRLARLLRLGRQPRTVKQLMTRPVVTARIDMAAVELVPLMANAGYHHIPVTGNDGRFAGMVTQSDVVAALYEMRLA